MSASHVDVEAPRREGDIPEGPTLRGRRRPRGGGLRRLRAGLVACVLGASLPWAAHASAAPSNDDFGDAIRLRGASGLYASEGSPATCEPGEVHFGREFDCPSIWFSWRAPDTGRLDVNISRTTDAIGSLQVLLYRGEAVDRLIEETYGSAIYDSTSTGFSFIVRGGVLYRIAVLDFFYADYELTWDLHPNPCTIVGSNRAETIIGTPGPDYICGLGGRDVVSGKEGSDVIDAGSGDDTVTFARSPRPVRAFLDIYHNQGWSTGWGNDRLEFVEGIVGSAYGDVLEGGIGDPRASPYGSGNVFTGGPGEDVLAGGWGSDRLHGGLGDDVLYPGISDGPRTGQVSDGGSGIDTVSYRGFSYLEAVTRLHLDLASGTVTGEGTRDRIVDIENASGGSYRDVIDGSSVDNVLRGGRLRDRIRGRGGDDTLLGESGNDALDGGPGTDLCRQGGGAGSDVDCEKT